MSKDIDEMHPIDLAFPVLALLAALWFAWLGIRWLDSNLAATDYCTDYTKVVSIEPIFEDDGKYEDETYLVRYENGLLESKDNGKIPPYKCLSWAEVKDGEPVSPGWKKSNYGHWDSQVNWGNRDD
jgi:hypothetical protein